MEKILRGIVPPLVTPLLDNMTLDIEGLERLIEHVIAGGVHGIFILGTTGEGASLDFNLKTEMIKHTSRIIKKRVPLLVGISDTSIVSSAQLAQIASKYGADAVVSAPPYYFSVAQSELVKFYDKLIPQLELPLYIYNIPSNTKVSFAPSTVREIAENEKVVGFKDSSANGTYLQSVLYEMKARKDFSIFVGPEEMLAQAVLMGASGGVNGGANIFPSLYVALYDAASTGNIDKARQLQLKVMQVSSKIYNLTNNSSSFLRGVKSALSVLGICNDFIAAPYNSFDNADRLKIAKAIDELQITNTNCT